MRNALLGLLAIVAIMLVVFFAYVAGQPGHVHVERSKVVAATPQDVWPYLSDLKMFTEWSPWTGIDPAQKVEFSDPSSGAGAWYTWAGNKEVGKGKMQIVQAEEPKKVVESLEFIEPFESKADVVMTTEAVAAGSKVTWAFDTDMGFTGKAAGVFMHMDSSLGADFSRGLDKLATLAEADAKSRIEKEKQAQAEAAAQQAAEAQASEAMPATP
jgi:carbon monoxide dehydrogenase subunit G